MFSTWKLGILKRKAKSLYTRITRNRLTFTFFLFGLFHCFSQGIIQSFLFTIDSEYSSFLSEIVHVAEVPAKNHTFLEGSSGNYRLRMCNYIPHFDSDCTDIFESRTSASDISSEDSVIRGNLLRANIGNNAQPVLFRNETGITVESQDGKDKVLLDMQCIKILVFPSQDLRNNEREDLAFVFVFQTSPMVANLPIPGIRLIFIQFWLFVISVIAMVYDSVPHIVAGFCARTLLTSWSAYALWRTHSKKSIYQELIGDSHTPCSVDLFNGHYFRVRNGYEIPDLILNLTALSISCYLSLTLFRDYNKRSFKCYFMAVQACLQLELYVLMAGMGLWIDQLFNTYIGAISEHTLVYEGVFIFYTVFLKLVIPWLVLGWYAIRHERTLLMALFIFASFVFLFTTSIMFYSQVFRWQVVFSFRAKTFVNWANLACFTVASMVLMGACMILGIICLRNFDKGLSHYLHADSILESLSFAPAVFENDVDYRVDSKAEHDRAIIYLEANFKLPLTGCS
ncbi:hypothetical protein DFS33DRAFT_1386928 [Desarmillaria ectypa]|nr:hypothetical protein DFS33DRAFT_1386928 [Desarmillaria ectypa]